MIKNAYDYALHSGAINPNIVKSLDEASNGAKFVEKEKTITENGIYPTMQNDGYNLIKYDSDFMGERVSMVFKGDDDENYSIQLVLIDQQLPQLNSKEDLISYALDNNFILFIEDRVIPINEEMLNGFWSGNWEDMDTRAVDGIIHGGEFGSCIVYDWKKAQKYNNASPFQKNGIYLGDINFMYNGYACIGQNKKINTPTLYNPINVDVKPDSFHQEPKTITENGTYSSFIDHYTEEIFYDENSPTDVIKVNNDLMPYATAYTPNLYLILLNNKTPLVNNLDDYINYIVPLQISYTYDKTNPEARRLFDEERLRTDFEFIQENAPMLMAAPVEKININNLTDFGIIGEIDIKTAPLIIYDIDKASTIFPGITKTGTYLLLDQQGDCGYIENRLINQPLLYNPIEVNVGSGVDNFNIEYTDYESSQNTNNLLVNTIKPQKISFGGTLQSNFAKGSSTAYPVLDINKEPLIPELSNLHGAAQAVVGNNLYIFGGTYKNTHSNVSWKATKQVLKIDIQTHQLSVLNIELPAMPSMYSALQAVSVGTNCYINGGFDDQEYTHQDIIKFDSINMTFEKLPNRLTKTRGNTVITAIGNNIYFFCEDKTIEKLDTTTSIITKINATLPHYYSYQNCVVLNQSCYLIGGLYTDSLSGSYSLTNSNEVYKFDSTTEQISKQKNLPASRAGGCGLIFGEYYYLFGGKGSNATGDISAKAITKYHLPSGNGEILNNVALPFEIDAFSTVYDTFYNNIYYLYDVDNLQAISIDFNSYSTQEGLLYIKCDNNYDNDFLMMSDNSTSLGINIGKVYKSDSRGYVQRISAFIYKNGQWEKI